MSASHAPALDAIAFQLVGVLDRYDQRVTAMIDTWLDMTVYCEVSDQVEEIRALSAALPQWSVHWVELLIAHAELVYSLWRLRFREEEADRSRFAQVRARHAACIASLRARCLRMIARSQDKAAD